MNYWIIATLALGLAGCASQPRRVELPPMQQQAAEAGQLAREAALHADATWSLSGRIAVTNGREGGSGRVEWQHSGDRYEVLLSAPVTRQSWQLTGDARQAQLAGLEGGVRTGADAGALLREATGWDIPVLALAEWVRGARASGLGDARIRYDAAGLPLHIEQGGWQIDYTWPAQASGLATLPTRIDARRGDARVKLIIDRWGQE